MCLSESFHRNFRRKQKKPFRIIFITKRGIFIINHWLKLGLQVPKNRRHCKRHNWGPALFKPLPQYSHNSAPFDDQSLKCNSSVRFVKNVYVSTMRENGLNALSLHFIHKGIALDCLMTTMPNETKKGCHLSRIHQCPAVIGFQLSSVVVIVWIKEMTL